MAHGLFRLQNFVTLKAIIISSPEDLLFPQSLLPYGSLNWSVRTILFSQRYIQPDIFFNSVVAQNVTV